MSSQASPSKPQLSSADRARLMLNLPELANRFCILSGEKVSVLHLGIGDLERFRPACESLEKLYLKFCECQIDIADFVKIYLNECLDLFFTDIPIAASIVLRESVDELKRKCRPVELLSAILAQWLHNLEIGNLQTLFPYPESEQSNEDDPNEGNPLVIAERLASAYHWSFDDALKRTIPQVYLMGVSSAQSYEKIKRESESNSGRPQGHPMRKAKPKPIEVGGERFSDFKKMNSHQYRAYVEQMFGGMPMKGDTIEQEG